jgi:hypothetical protein
MCVLKDLLMVFLRRILLIMSLFIIPMQGMHTWLRGIDGKGTLIQKTFSVGSFQKFNMSEVPITVHIDETLPPSTIKVIGQANVLDNLYIYAKNEILYIRPQKGVTLYKFLPLHVYVAQSIIEKPYNK